MNPTISIIAAVSENKVIGKDNKLLWKIPEDMQRFKKLTLGHPVIMGRNTFNSIGKPLTGRTNIIVTRNLNYKPSNCITANSIEEAIKKAQKKDQQEIFIIGGSQIYEQGIKYADKLYLTIVKGDFKGDAFFPDYSEFKKVISKEEKKSAGLEYTFLELIKK